MTEVEDIRGMVVMTEVRDTTKAEAPEDQEVMTGMEKGIKRERHTSHKCRAHDAELGITKGGCKMKKLILGTIFMALIMVFPISAMAMGGRVDVGVSIPLPPHIQFAAPPEMVVIPETYVYFVPDVDEEIFFYGGWWWRPWNGRWYRSQNYNSGWAYYESVPSFYRDVPSGWRNDYRQHRWGGRPWNYQRIPHQQVHQNWNSWEKNRHWEKQNNWGVQGLTHQPRSQQPAPVVQQQQIRPRHDTPQVREPVRQQQPRPKMRKAVRQHKSIPKARQVKQQRSKHQTDKVQKKSRPQKGKPGKGHKEKKGRN